MWLFFLQLKNELLKLFARKRTYLGFGAFLLLEGLIIFLLQLPRVQGAFRKVIEGSGFGFDEYFSGLTLALLVMQWTVFLLGGLYVALVAGDIVAKEVEDGAMRMVLSRPVSRGRVVLVKWLSCLVYVLVLVFFIAASALLMGVLIRGVGGLFVMDPTQDVFGLYSWGEGLARFFAGLLLLCISLGFVASLAFFLSCFAIKPAAATIATLTYLFLDIILRQVPYFQSIEPWFVSGRMGSWMRVFSEPVPISVLVENYAVLCALCFSLFLLGRVVFLGRDFKA